MKQMVEGMLWIGAIFFLQLADPIPAAATQGHGGIGLPAADSAR